jgi:hypothetical protein
LKYGNRFSLWRDVVLTAYVRIEARNFDTFSASWLRKIQNLSCVFWLRGGDIGDCLLIVPVGKHNQRIIDAVENAGR